VAAFARIIPLDGNASKFVSGHVILHTVEFFKMLQQKVEMFNANVFDPKVIHDEAKLEWLPFMVPKSWHGSSFVEALSNEAQLEKIIGKEAILGKSVTSLANFKVDPAVSVLAQEIVFLDELVQDVRELDANIFWIRRRSVQIEVLEINGAEPSSFPGEDTIEYELDEFKQGCVGAHIARIANPVAANGDTGAVRIILFGTYLTNDHGVADSLALVGRDVLVINDVEGVGTHYPLTSWSGARSDALAELI
jgi:hypothetical protein